ncbi:hypothetical protein CB1_078722006 [Camelus ferus]|nr:hypothetical protein CB1_078722006 [Camelus ferus]
MESAVTTGTKYLAVWTLVERRRCSDSMRTFVSDAGQTKSKEEIGHTRHSYHQQHLKAGAKLYGALCEGQKGCVPPLWVPLSKGQGSLLNGVVFSNAARVLPHAVLTQQIKREIRIWGRLGWDPNAKAMMPVAQFKSHQGCGAVRRLCWQESVSYQHQGTGNAGIPPNRPPHLQATERILRARLAVGDC